MKKNRLILFLIFLPSCILYRSKRLSCEFCKTINYDNSIVYKQVLLKKYTTGDSLNFKDFYLSECFKIKLNISMKFNEAEIGYAFVEIKKDTLNLLSIDVLEIGKIDTINYKMVELFNEQIQYFKSLKQKKLAIKLINQIKLNTISIINDEKIITNHDSKILNIIWNSNSS